MSRIIDATLRFIDKFTTPMQNATKKFERNGKQIQRVGKDIEKTGKKFERMGSSMTKALTLPIVGVGAAAIHAGIEFESAFAGVKKTLDTTGLKAEETTKLFADLKNGILDMSTEIPMAATEISAIAESAGQLGIARENVLNFSRVIADLSVSTNLTSDEAASNLAKFANVTNMNPQDYQKLGSVIVDLGNNFATTESDIVAMGMRLAGAGAQIGLSESEIMGYAAALSSVGIEAEAGGTAFSKAMIEMKMATATGLSQVQEISKKTQLTLRELQLMSENDTKGFKEMAAGLGMTKTELLNVVKAGVRLENFSEIAGMTTENFKKLFETSPEKALEKFISGLGNTENVGKSTIEMLQEMGFTEVRLRDSLTRLANGSDMVSDALDTGKKAWEENTALTKEAEQRYQTTESKIQLLKNNITRLGIEIKDMLAPSIDKVIDSVDKFTKWLMNLDDSTKQSILRFAGFAAVVGPSLLGFGKITKGVGRTIQAFGKFEKNVPELCERAKKSFDILKTIKPPPLSNFSDFSKGIGGAFGKAGKAISTFLGPGNTVILVIAAIALGAFLIIKNWNKIKPMFDKVGKAIKNVFEKCGLDIDKFKEVFKGLIDTVKNIIGQIKLAFDKIKPIIEPILEFIKNVFVEGVKIYFDTIVSIVAGAIKGIQDVLSGITTVLNGISDFISGVFTGNWEKAWQGVKTIFKGIFESLVGIVKAPINAVISIINGAINGINKIGFKIPDWVPFIGGEDFSINIPTIPMLYTGTDNWQGGLAMIHDRGAEIVDLPKGARVYPHDKSLEMAKVSGIQAAGNVIKNSLSGLSKNFAVPPIVLKDKAQSINKTSSPDLAKVSTLPKIVEKKKNESTNSIDKKILSDLSKNFTALQTIQKDKAQPVNKTSLINLDKVSTMPKIVEKKKNEPDNINKNSLFGLSKNFAVPQLNLKNKVQPTGEKSLSGLSKNFVTPTIGDKNKIGKVDLVKAAETLKIIEKKKNESNNINKSPLFGLSKNFAIPQLNLKNKVQPTGEKSLFGLSKNFVTPTIGKETNTLKKPSVVSNSRTIINNYSKSPATIVKETSGSSSSKTPKIDVEINISDVKVNGYKDIEKLADDIAKIFVKKIKKVSYNM